MNILCEDNWQAERKVNPSRPRILSVAPVSVDDGCTVRVHLLYIHLFVVLELRVSESPSLRVSVWAAGMPKVLSPPRPLSSRVSLTSRSDGRGGGISGGRVADVRDTVTRCYRNQVHVEVRAVRMTLLIYTHDAMLDVMSSSSSLQRRRIAAGTNRFPS